MVNENKSIKNITSYIFIFYIRYLKSDNFAINSKILLDKASLYYISNVVYHFLRIFLLNKNIIILLISFIVIWHHHIIVFRVISRQVIIIHLACIIIISRHLV